MPVYVYRAMTKDGHIVRNKIEDSSKNSVIKKVKRNGLMPISVVQLRAKAQKSKKNLRNVDQMLENLNNGNVIRKKIKRKESIKEKLSNFIISTNKISTKDVVVFTQKFYLLKKANFNNIHALSTIIESTENDSFRYILEDILLGVEAGENMYVTMEYYEGVFPPIYINMIRVGELSRVTNKSIRTGY